MRPIIIIQQTFNYPHLGIKIYPIMTQATRRVQKQTRYDPLIKMIDGMIRYLRLTNKYVKQAEINEVSLNRNYGVIFLGICLIEKQLMKRGWKSQEMNYLVFDYMEKNLDKVLKIKYSGSQNSQQLIKVTKEKNLRDLKIISFIFSLDGYDEEMMKLQLMNLYETKQKKRIQKTLKILKNFRSADLQSQMKSQPIINTNMDESCLNDFIQEQNQSRMQVQLPNQSRVTQIEIASIYGGYTTL